MRRMALLAAGAVATLGLTAPAMAAPAGFGVRTTGAAPALQQVDWGWCGRGRHHYRCYYGYRGPGIYLNFGNWGRHRHHGWRHRDRDDDHDRGHHRHRGHH